MNEKVVNNLMLALKVLSGCIIHYLGGWDMLLRTILLLVVLDFATGWMKAILHKALSSEIGFVGLLKKVLIFIVIAVASSIQVILRDTIPLRETIIMFYCVNEALSIVENISYFIPIPRELRNVLKQIKEGREDKLGQKGENGEGQV